MNPSAWSLAERWLEPLFKLYSTVPFARRRLAEWGLTLPVSVAVPVISVGGITQGGSGKTPIARFLASQLASQGRQVAVVVGGYGGSERAPTLLPSGGAWEAEAVRRHGDEAVMMAAWLSGGWVASGRDKARTAALAVAHGADLVVLDDGFQHLGLARQLDIVLAAPGAGVWLREHPKALARAHLVWDHRRNGRLRGPWAGPVRSRLCASRLLDGQGRDQGPASALRGQRVYLLAGVAQPRAFEELVTDLGAIVVDRCFVRDHRPINLGRLDRARRRRADLLLCTEKDAVRMVGQPGWMDVRALGCQVELVAGESLLAQHLRAIGVPWPG